MQDNLSDGKKFRVLNVIDDFNRECLAIVPSKSITSHRVISELENLTTWRGVPEKIRVDNGPEFIAERLKDWCFFKGVELTFIQPGKPAPNGYIERFNRTFRDEVLSMHLFSSLESFKNTAHQWVHVYNHKRPHCSLANLSPRNFLLKHAKPHLIDSDFPTFQIDN